MNQKTQVLNDFTKADITQLEWEGRQAIFSLHSSRNVGVKASAESGLLPAAGAQGYTALKVPMCYVYGRMQLTAQVIKQSRSNKGSFARAMDTEQAGLVNDLARQRNRILFGTGKGTLCLAVGSGSNTVTMAVDTPGGVSGSTNGTRFLQSGMVIAIYAASPAVGDAPTAVRTISSIDSTSQITLDAVATWADNAIITLGAVSGATVEGSYGLEPVGLLGIDDGTTYLTTIHGINRSTAANAFFKSLVLTSVGSLSFDILQRLTDNVEEISGEVIDKYYCHSSVRREFLRQYEADRRYTNDKMTPDGGTSAGNFKANLKFNTVEIQHEKDCPYGTLFAVNKSHLFWIPLEEGQWADDDGRILLRISNVDAYEARFRVFENFLSDKGNALGRMDGITATVTNAVYSA